MRYSMIIILIILLVIISGCNEIQQKETDSDNIKQKLSVFRSSVITHFTNCDKLDDTNLIRGTFDKDTNITERDYCLIRNALLENDPGICQNIHRGFSKGLCTSNLINNELSRAELEYSFLKQAVLESNDTDLCNLLKEEHIEICKGQIVAKSEVASNCYKLEGNARKVCIQSLLLDSDDETDCDNFSEADKEECYYNIAMSAFNGEGYDPNCVICPHGPSNYTRSEYYCNLIVKDPRLKQKCFDNFLNK